jgi:CRISPR-associated protein Cmr2
VERLQEQQRALEYRAALPNKLLLDVEVEPPGGGATVLDFAKELRKEAWSWLEAEVRQGTSDKDLGVLVDEQAWEQQLQAINQGDFLEFFAACSDEISEQSGLSSQIAKAQARLEESKALRAFLPASWSRSGRRKSYLDTGRDSVLRQSESREEREWNTTELRAQLGLSDGEQLDAIGLARRMAVFRQGGSSGSLRRQGELPTLPFPPISRVAAEPWLRGRGRELGSLRGALHNALESDNESDRALFWSVSSPSWDSWEAGKALFPFDASILFEGGLDSAEQTLDHAGRRNADAWTKICDAVLELHKSGPPPLPYYALLTFDGDGVGKSLKELTRKDPKFLDEAYGKLDVFVDTAAARFAGPEVRGCMFYVGGDEGTGYLPLDRLPQAVRALQESYQPVQRYFKDRGAAHGGEPLHTTLSIGVVVAHYKDNLRDVRDAAGAALEAAKRARTMEVGPTPPGMVCIRMRARGGSDRDVVAPAEEWVERTSPWMSHLEAGELGLTLVHAMLEERGAWPKHGSETDAVFDAYFRAKRSFERSGRSGAPLLNALKKCRTWREVEGLAAELILAQWMWRSAQQNPQQLEENEVSHANS